MKTQSLLKFPFDVSPLSGIEAENAIALYLDLFQLSGWIPF